MPTALQLAPPDFRPSYGSADPYLFKKKCLESPKSSKKAPLNQRMYLHIKSRLGRNGAFL